MAINLTHRQNQVLSFVLQALRKRALPPTRAEIATAMGFAVAASAQEHLQALVRKGYIAIAPGQSRALTVLKNPDGSPYHPYQESIGTVSSVLNKSKNEARLPIVGSVRAGQPIVASDHIESYLPVQAKLFQPRADFLLRVRGDSMCDAGILQGDLLAVHKTNLAASGQIIVARVGDDITVKFFRRTEDSVSLVPANSNYAAITIALDDAQFAVEGLVVGVIRRFAH
jgi:repressor LexA